MSSSPIETIVDLTMPQMGVSVVEGTVAEWRKEPGDWVERDEIICSISTDKIDTDVEAPASGRVSELLVAVGETVEVGVVLARIATDAKPGEPHAAEAIAPVRSAPRRYSPVVARMAAEHGLDLERVEGTGRDGRVRKQDVLAFLAAGAEPAPKPPMHIESPYRPDPVPPPAAGAPLSRMRQGIGKRMLESLRTAATCTTIVECDMSRVEAARRQSGLTYLPYVAAATVATLRDGFGALNATLEGDTLTPYEPVHLGIAVSLGAEGLIVPVIRDAQDLSVEGLGARIKVLAAKARAHALTPDDVRGGTFTITNPGAYGAILATPVINQPQVAILDAEAVVKRAVVVTDEAGDDAIAIRPMTCFCMSWDHRALDGALAAQFLTAVRKRLER